MRRTSKNKRRFSALESLELRMLLSVTIDAAGKTAAYTDVDGDAVTIKVTAGALTGGNFTTVAQGLGEYIEKIDLSAGGFDNTGLTLTVKKSATGDGLANVGLIDSTGHTLGAVTIAGDLGRIIAGNAAGVAVKSLSTRTMGRMGLDNQPGGTFSLTSSISGTLGSLSTKGDASAVFINADNFGAVTIGGSFHLSYLNSGANIGAVKITGDLTGGSEVNSGFINATGNIASLAVGGSIIGGTTNFTGGAKAGGNMGSVTVAGNLLGGSESLAGALRADGSLGNVSIGGSLIGGSISLSGIIQAGNNLGAVTVKRDLIGGVGDNSGYITGGSIAGLTVGGSVVGGDGVQSGALFANASAGNIKIGGDLRGGAGMNSGLCFVSAAAKSVTIGGSIIGGIGESSGKFNAVGNVISLTVAGDIRGGAGLLSGSLICNQTLSTLKIGASLLGGQNENSGYIEINNLGAATIAGDIVGSSPSGFQNFNSTGLVNTNTIKSLSVGGSVFAGVNNSLAALNLSGAIVAAQGLGTLAVKGSLVGAVGSAGVSNVFIVAKAVPTQTATDLVIKSITIGGRMEYAKILAGYTPDLVPVPDNGDAQIGAVKIGGDMIASSIVAGVKNAASSNVSFGDANDASIGAGNANIISAIDSVAIGGIVMGTPDAANNTDHFGIVAQFIKSVKIGNVAVALGANAGGDNIAIGLFSDFNIHEV